MKTVDETVHVIREIAQQIGFTGQNWKRLMDALNQAGATSRRNQSWNNIQSLQQWCARNKVFVGNEAPEEAMQVDDAEQLELVAGEMQGHVENIEKEISGAITEHIEPSVAENLPLTPEEIAGLRQMLAAWRDRSDPSEHIIPEQIRDFRPMFQGPRQNTGVRLNSDLIKDAKAKAKAEDPIMTANGQLSPLVEFLLWKYLNFDKKYVGPKKENDK